jgi:hypothetical protein
MGADEVGMLKGLTQRRASLTGSLGSMGPYSQPTLRDARRSVQLGMRLVAKPQNLKPGMSTI